MVRQNERSVGRKTGAAQRPRAEERAPQRAEVSPRYRLRNTRTAGSISGGSTSRDSAASSAQANPRWAS